MTEEYYIRGIKMKREIEKLVLWLRENVEKAGAKGLIFGMSGECELPLSEEEAEAVKNAIASNSPQPTTTTIAGGKKIRKINKSKAQSEETPSKKEAVAKKKSASQSTTKENK